MRVSLPEVGLVVFVVGACFGPAAAADIPVKAPAPVVSSAPVPWIVLFGGLVAVKDSTYGYAGGVAAFNHNLDQEGWLVRLAGGTGHYKYNIVPGLSDGVNFQAGDAMIGYQKFFGTTRVSGYVGLNIEDHQNNLDPLAQIKGTRAGIKGQGEIFAPVSPSWYLYGQATYSSVWNNYLLMGKAGYNLTPVISIGPEVMSLGNVRFDALRVGPFVGINIGPSAQLILSGGYSWDMRRDSVNDHSGAYGAVHVRTTF